MTPEQIARGLTKAQREAMLANHWSARQGAGLQKLGLTYWGNGPHRRPMVKFSQIGRAVRAELERIADIRALDPAKIVGEG